MNAKTSSRESAVLAGFGHPVSNPADYDHLIDLAGDARLVLISEASHGTADFIPLAPTLLGG